MADNLQTTQGQTGVATAGAGAATLISDDVVIDRNKSAEQYMKEVEAKYIIPPLVREKFPDLVKLIYETESMNQEEREYWLQIMPIMTEEQIVKFREILVNEKEQLAKLDKEYESEVNRVAQTNQNVLDEAKMKEKMTKIKEAEKAGEAAEVVKEEELLKKLGGEA